jgi:hypothetical protein
MVDWPKNIWPLLNMLLESKLASKRSLSKTRMIAVQRRLKSVLLRTL